MKLNGSYVGLSEKAMFVREIDIENFRCFEKMHVVLDRNCNVVIGNNG